MATITTTPSPNPTIPLPTTTTSPSAASTLAVTSPSSPKLNSNPNATTSTSKPTPGSAPAPKTISKPPPTTSTSGPGAGGKKKKKGGGGLGGFFAALCGGSKGHEDAVKATPTAGGARVGVKGPTGTGAGDTLASKGKVGAGVGGNIVEPTVAGGMEQAGGKGVTQSSPVLGSSGNKENVPATTTTTTTSNTATLPPSTSTSKALPIPATTSNPTSTSTGPTATLPLTVSSNNSRDKELEEKNPLQSPIVDKHDSGSGGLPTGIFPRQTGSDSGPSSGPGFQPVTPPKTSTSPASTGLGIPGVAAAIGGAGVAGVGMAAAGGLGRESPAREVGMTEVELGMDGYAEGSGSGIAGGKEREGDGEVVVPQGGVEGGVRMPLDETEGLTSGAVQPPGSGHLSVPHSHSTPTHQHNRDPHAPSSSSQTYTSSYGDVSLGDDSLVSDTGSDPDVEASRAQGQADGDRYLGEEDEEDLEMDEEDRLIAQGGIGIPIGPDGKPAPLLPLMSAEHEGRKCLILDLDETLLHSSFKMINSADYIVPVEIESQTHNVYVIKRPGVDNFLKQMGEIYEVVVFTASLSKYADPVLDMLDVHRVVKHRLFRESCYNHKGNYVKDLSQLGREMSKSIIIDNSPASYIFHPNNAVPVSTWFNDPHDTELTDLSPFLTDLATVDDIRCVLDGSL